MIRTFRFDKDPDGRWYVNLPEWEGDRAELEMVLGADMLLDILSNDCDWIDLEMADYPFSPNCKTLTHDKSQNELGWYNNNAWHGPSTIWLCSVTEFVFGSYPDIIYYR
jgi:hypothetical protein